MRYSGKLGIVTEQEVKPGSWEDEIEEVDVLGTVGQTSEVLSGEGDVHPRYSTTTNIRVSALSVGQVDRSNFRYITYKGKRWQIATIVDEPPKIVVYIGEEYHGPGPSSSSS